jgi:nitrogen fixation/metabolism regulation signal transduction histidine kinase
VRRERLGPTVVPVAYARVDLPGARAPSVVGVPLVLQQRDIARTVDRMGEMLLLVTVLTAALLSIAAAWVARSVARPVGLLAAATARIARGDYGARLTTRTRDEIASLVDGFNAMSDALARQRADLERRRDYMEALLSNATTGVISTDPGGRIVTVNPAAERLIEDVGGRLLVGDSIAAALAPIPSLASFLPALTRPIDGDARTDEVDLDLPAGRRRLRIVRVALPDPQGGAPGTLVLADDVTDLMRSNQLAAWAEMARAIAHEIKNPLTPIQLSTEHLERLLRDRGVLPGAEIESCLAAILKQVRALRDIAAEFGAYAKLPALDLRPADPAAFLREIVSPYRDAPPAGVVVDERHEDAPWVLLDRRVLARAIVNLVENALQAMPAGGVLTVRSGPHPDGGAFLSIEDTGAGLSREARERLFEPYFSTKSTGTGLGLAIARRAVEGHRGRIEIESAPGRGSTFRVVLPKAAAPGPVILTP